MIAKLIATHAITSVALASTAETEVHAIEVHAIGADKIVDDCSALEPQRGLTTCILFVETQDGVMSTAGGYSDQLVQAGWHPTHLAMDVGYFERPFSDKCSSFLTATFTWPASELHADLFASVISLPDSSEVVVEAALVLHIADTPICDDHRWYQP